MEQKKNRGHQPGVPNPNGGRKKGSGSGTKRVRFQISCQPEEEKIIRENAKKAGLSLSAFMVKCALNN